MSEVRLFVFDDREARRWAPFTLTRPAGELLFGCLRLRERAERVFGVTCQGHLTRAALVGFDEPHAAPVVPLEDVGAHGTRILISSRAVPDFQPVELPDVPARITVGGRPAGWVLPEGTALPSELWLRDPGADRETDAVVEMEGHLLEPPKRARIARSGPWTLVADNARRIAADVAHLFPDDTPTPGAVRVGSGTVSLAPGAEVEPGVYLDTRKGPIRLGAGVRVEGPARLTGPLFVGQDSTLLGGAIGTSSFGRVCRVRGEVADSVFLDFVNKAHDGHIGHALLGCWVNLGAFTTNSDLKNNYRPVRVWTLGGETDTGLLKVGCFLGDHVKTGIGTVLNTGTVVGAGSNLFGGLMPPSVVPPFSWGMGPDLRDHRLAKFLESAVRAMERREQRLTPGMERILREAWADTAGRRAV